MHAMKAKTTFCTPISNQKLDLSGFAYVDDTDLITLTDTNDKYEAMKKMQHSLNVWESVSKTTGGALEPSKCCGWIASFKWSGSTWSYKKNHDNEDLELVTKDKDDKLGNISVLPVTSAQKMLGVYLSPDGKDARQKKYLTTKMKRMGEYARVGHLSHKESWIALSLVATKALEFSVPALTMMEQDNKDILQPIMKTYLPKAGFNRNIEQKVLYGSHNSQGLNLTNPYLLQGSSHVEDILHNLWKENITGHLITSNLEQLHIELGENVSILQSQITDFENQLHTNSWVRDTWKFMSQFGIHLEDNTSFITPLRHSDCTLMEKFKQNPDIKGWQIRIINKCRLYLQVFLLSDIVTGDGKKIY
jgi:hypothetical protein